MAASVDPESQMKLSPRRQTAGKSTAAKRDEVSELQLTDRDPAERSISQSQVEINTRRKKDRMPTKALGRDSELSSPLLNPMETEMNEDDDIANFNQASPTVEA